MDEITPGGDRSTADTPSVQAVETSMAIIDALQDIGPATLSEIAAAVDMSKGGTYKHLMTLEQERFVVQVGNQYRLGFRFLDIGGRLRNDHPGSELIKAEMQELADTTGETAIYTVLEDDRTVTLFREIGDRGISTRAGVGEWHYPHSTAAGKCLLAHQPREDIEDIFSEESLPQLTDNTISDVDALSDELATARERGYTYNIGESMDGITAIAAPLMPDDHLLGACSIIGPDHRLRGNPVDEEIESTLLSSVKELERNIARSQIL